jgi:RNA polymerase sigma factor (sigma-70 family)
MAGGPDSQTLYTLCRQEGTSAQAAAFQELGTYLHRVAFYLVRGRPELHDLAEDCTQEALLTIWRSLDTCQKPDRFLSWATCIVINKMRDEFRRLGMTGVPVAAAEGTPAAQMPRRRRVPLAQLESLSADEETPLLDLLVGQEAEAAERYERTETRSLLLQGIARHPDLSAASKLVLLRGFLEDRDDGDLARDLHTSRSNVHTIRCRDLAALRRDAAFVQKLRAYLGMKG